jgi:hypothetical protein
MRALGVDVGVDFGGPPRGGLRFLPLDARTISELVRDGRAVLGTLRLRLGLLAKLTRLVSLALELPLASTARRPEDQSDDDDHCNGDHDPDPGVHAIAIPGLRRR